MGLLAFARLAMAGWRLERALARIEPLHEASLAADAAALAALAAITAGRPVWLAASTHPGEEAIIAAAHRTLRTRWPDLLTVIAPRHAERGEAIAGELAAAGFRIARRSQGKDKLGKGEV